LPIIAQRRWVEVKLHWSKKRTTDIKALKTTMQGGEITQTLYTHMNKIKIKKKKIQTAKAEQHPINSRHRSVSGMVSGAQGPAGHFPWQHLGGRALRD
jgi:outer membrane receptor for Fe3+-dicitrate